MGRSLQRFSFLALLRKAPGRIVNISSVGAHIAIPFGSLINASKSAFGMFSDVLLTLPRILPEFISRCDGASDGRSADQVWRSRLRCGPKSQKACGLEPPTSVLRNLSERSFQHVAEPA